MEEFFKVLKAEAIKQHKNYFHSKLIYVSLFIWPIISFISTYYSFKPFNLDNSNIPYLNKENMIIFILLGYMSMSFFRSLVQSAWKFSYERVSGTLELIYLSPASRQGVILGNAISSLFESIIVMLFFAFAMIIFKYEVLNINIFSAMIVFLVTMLMAVLWGMFLNSLFLFSRDSGFLFTILEEPMEIFSGVKVPTVLFPLWAKIVSFIFPLTYAIEAVRKVFLSGSTLYDLRGFLLVGILIILILYSLSLIILKRVELHSRKTGNLTLF